MRCPACEQADLEPFFEQPRVPVLCNVLLATAAEARAAATGDIVLGFCARCGMIANTAFDAAAIGYGQAYENSLHFSPHFDAWARGLAADLAARHALRGGTVVDIGCGKGDFLRLLCAAGPCRGVGFDTSWEGGDGEQPAGAGAFRVVRAFYDESHGDLGADLVCCRHVLEHIPAPRPFLDGIRRAASGQPSARVYFEVPNALWTLRDLGIWDVIYEHCSYYADVALTSLFASTGFGRPATRPEFGGQYLCLEADVRGAADTHPAAGQDPAALHELIGLARDFGRHHRAKVEHWSRRLAELHGAGRRVAIWGAGSKGVTFLNTVAGGDAIACAVDVNTRKQGRHVPGTAQAVVDPTALAGLGVDTVLVMNALYRDEIAARLDACGVDAALEAV